MSFRPATPDLRRGLSNPPDTPHLSRAAMIAVRAQWRTIRPRAASVAETFLDLLAEEHPDLRALLPRVDRDTLVRRVVTRVHMVVNSIDRLTLVRVALDVLAQDANRRGIREPGLRRLRELWLRALLERRAVSRKELWAWEEAADRVIAMLASTLARVGRPGVTGSDRSAGSR